MEKNLRDGGDDPRAEALLKRREIDFLLPKNIFFFKKTPGRR